MRRMVLMAVATVSAVVLVATHRLPLASLLPIPQENLTKPNTPIGQVALIKMDKSERLLRLLLNNEVVASYKIALGDSPEGRKQREGDERTLEGLYGIDWRNSKGVYFSRSPSPIRTQMMPHAQKPQPIPRAA